MTEHETPHETVRALLPAYSLGALDPEEERLCQAHLQDCPACRAELQTYRQVATALLLAAPAPAAPPGLRAALLRRVTAPPPAPAAPREALWPRLAAVAAGLALGLLLAGNILLSLQVRGLEGRLRAAEAALDLMTRPTMTVRELRGTEPAAGARGRLYLVPDHRQALLVVADLPAPPADRVYQLWLIRDGQRISGGLFRVDAQGRAWVLVQAPEPLGQYQAVGVTVEPAGGSPGPTGQRVLWGTLSG